MGLDYVEVIRDNMMYRYPVETIKVIDTDDDGADVIVEFPSYSIPECRISIEVLAKLLARRLAGYSFHPKPEPYLVIFMGGGPLHGPVENPVRRLHRLWWNTTSNS